MSQSSLPTTSVPVPVPVPVPHSSPLAKSIGWNDLDGLLFGIYGGIYILTTDLILYPADLLTTKLQNDKHTNQRGVKLRKLTTDIYKREGVRGLFRGFVPATLGSFPGQFLYYSSYEYTNEKLREMTGYDSSTRAGLVKDFFFHCGAGFTAELVSGLAYLPSDVVSQRLQIERRINFLHSKYTFQSTQDVMRYIWRTEGFRGFYRGYGIYLLVYGPSSAVWWSSYEFIKRGLKRLVSDSKSKLREWPLTLDLIHCVSGGLAGTLSTIVTHPLDLVRTRLQLLDVSSASERQTLALGFQSLLKSVYREEGWRGCIKGLKPRIYVRGPGSAIAFTGYEWLKQASSKDKEGQG